MNLNAYTACLEDAVIRGHIFKGVLHDDQHTITFFEPARQEKVCYFVGEGIYLGIGESMLCVEECNLVRISLTGITLEIRGRAAPLCNTF